MIAINRTKITDSKADYSILVGGQHEDNVELAGTQIAHLFNRMGYWVFTYEEYQPLIVAGHDFVIVRGSSEKILAHTKRINILIALDEESIERHRTSLPSTNGLIITDSARVDSGTLDLPFSEMVIRNGLPKDCKSTAVFATLASVIGVPFVVAEQVLKRNLKDKINENVDLAKECYELTDGKSLGLEIPFLHGLPKPLIDGNEAVALGAVKAGLKLYFSCPMIPSSGILQYLAQYCTELDVTTIRPDNEIIAASLAEGASFAGLKSMVGTSSSGFGLMAESLSFAGQAEIPIVIVLSQRLGPSAGMPTYQFQGDLLSSIFIGPGEFPRMILAPGDTEEAFNLAADSINLAWKFQIPVILLTDHLLGENILSTDIKKGDIRRAREEHPKVWRRKSLYKRYQFTKDGISPLTYPSTPGAVVKANCYSHDEFGLTSEDGRISELTFEKRIRKMKAIEKHMERYETVKAFGNERSEAAVVTWGSTKGVSIEAAKALGVSVVQILCLHPLPANKINCLLQARENVVSVEANSTGQLAEWLKFHGIKVHHSIVKSDGRAMSVEELLSKLEEVMT